MNGTTGESNVRQGLNQLLTRETSVGRLRVYPDVGSGNCHDVATQVDSGHLAVHRKQIHDGRKFNIESLILYSASRFLHHSHFSDIYAQG